MEFAISVAIASAIVLALLISGGIVFALWQQRAGEEDPVLLDGVLRRMGDGVAHRVLATGGRDFAVAVNQCVECRQAAQCRTWLASGATDGYECFCPNAGFIQRAKRLGA
jgi:hypothetical protein